MLFQTDAVVLAHDLVTPEVGIVFLSAEFLIFTGQSGEQSIEARYEDETIWLSQKLNLPLQLPYRQDISNYQSFF